MPMAVDGTYGFVYCGTQGLGIGIFRVRQGGVEGLDYVGGRYSGTAIEVAGGSIHLRITMEVRPGTILVQGTAPQDLPHTREIDHVFPPVFGDGKPIEVNAPPGMVTVMIRRIPDDFNRGMSAVQMGPIPEPAPSAAK
jgi:hypothetical protein